MVIVKYIKKMLRSAIGWVLKDERPRAYPEDSPSVMPSMSGISSGSNKANNNINLNGMNFTIYSATGGKVVEFKTYDPRNDRSINTLYVITDKEDLGEELGQIITKESLCR